MKKVLLLLVLLFSFQLLGDIPRNDDKQNERLFAAIKSGSTTAVSEALIKGAQINSARNSDGHSPLLYAQENQSIEIFDHLLRCGCDPNAACSDSGNSILDVLTSSGSLPYLQSFIRFGGDINTPIKNLQGASESYLVWVVRSGKVDLYYESIRAGANMNVRDAHGKTLIMVAVKKHYYQMAYNLLRTGAAIPEIDLIPHCFDVQLQEENTFMNEAYWKQKFIDELKHQIDLKNEKPKEKALKAP